MRILISALLLTLASAGVSTQPPDDGEVSGRLMDTAGIGIPGVEVTVAAGEVRRAVVTDHEGEFRVAALPRAIYRVSTRIDGFVPASGTVALGARVRHVRIDWTLTVGCMEGASTVRVPLRQSARTLKAVIHARVTGVAEPALHSSRPECEAAERRVYPIEVLRSVSIEAAVEPTVPSQWLMDVPHGTPLSTGQECLILVWRFTRVQGGVVLPLAFGRVVSSRDSDDAVNGLSVDDVIASLREWRRGADVAR